MARPSRALDFRPALDHSDQSTHPRLVVAAMTHIANPRSGEVPHATPAVVSGALVFGAAANSLRVTRFSHPGFARVNVSQAQLDSFSSFCGAKQSASHE